jgi:hypothetical protein
MAELVNQNRVWTTARVDDALARYEKMGTWKGTGCPFWEKEIGWRDANIPFLPTEEEYDEIEKCAEDVLYFANKYCHVMTDDGVRQVKLRDYQENILDIYDRERFVCFLAPRQIGKTITSAIYIAHFLCFNRDKNVMILANKGDTVKEIMDKVKTIIVNLPFFMKPGVEVNNVMNVKFDNGCRIAAQTTTRKAALGFAIHLLYADEFAHIPSNIIDEFFKSIYPTLSSSQISRMIITSTANGPNKFYDLFSNAYNNQYDPDARNSFYGHEVKWWEVPGRDEAWMKREIANFGGGSAGEEAFNQEYGNQFFSSSRLLIDSDSLKEMRDSREDYVWHEIESLTDLDIEHEGLRWHPGIESFNFDDSHRFVVTVDLGGGVGKDYSILNVFQLMPLSIQQIRNKKMFEDEKDFYAFRQIALFRDNRKSVDDVVPIAKALIFEVLGGDRTRVVVETNFEGNHFMKQLGQHDDFYDEMFLKTHHSKNDIIMRPGVRINQENKPFYCKAFRKLVQTSRVIVDEKYTVGELTGFGVDKHGKYRCEVGHDDAAMSSIILSAFFDTEWMVEMVDDIYDFLPDAFKTEIEKKLNMNGSEQISDDVEYYKIFSDF